MGHRANPRPPPRREPRMSAHRLVIARDEEDWYWITCSCGFESGPFPGHSHAVDEADDHEADVEAGA